ncbi:MAG TPA: protein kinase [Bryobacteraceae bacterium]|nr:protein kinase [Bryobacteraceae bacterium]
MPTAQVLQFGPFELGVRSGQLRKHGIRIRLQEQSFQILLMLLDHPGEVVQREDIRLRLWPNNTIVEFDHSINAAIKRLRNALGETAEAPRYIETLAKRGYRFVGEVARVGEPPGGARLDADPEPDGADLPAAGDLNGKAISHYQILDKLGEGGMGTVYRAEDLNLRRKVAVKFLPLTDGPLPEPALRRFEREARAASALNHPNICTVYGLEEFDGKPAIVMELVEGETLAARLSKGPLPPEIAVGLAVQIAGALAEAHRRGVIHRDLKPGNIMLTGPKSRPNVKVLDFGLAKFERPAAGSSPDAETVTERGALVGTLHYMSPEQVEGKDADARSDIFSFGLVLYEIVTGQRAFEAESRASVIAAILEKEPPPIEPAWLNRVIHACVAKDPNERFQTARDVKRALEWGEATAAPVAPRESRSWIPWAAAALFAALALLVWLRTGPFASRAPRLAVTIMSPGANRGNWLSAPVISPDGSSVLYGANNQLWLRRLDSLEPRSLGVLGNDPILWSPDSRMAAFRQGGALVRVRLPDGAPELVAPFKGPTRGGSWSETGTILISGDVNGSELCAAPASGGEFKPVETAGMKEGYYLWPEFLPGGEDFLFLLVPTGEQMGEVYLATLRNGKAMNPVLLTKNETAASYTPAGGGRLLFVRNGNLYSQKLDRRARKLVGEAGLVQAGIFSIPVASVSHASFSVSRTGVVASRPGRAALNQVTIFDRQGKELGTAGPPMSVGWIALSPDEKRLLAAGNGSWLLEAGQPGSVKLPAGRWGFWSPDGSRWIGILGSGRWLAERPADLTSEPREIRPTPDGMASLQDVSPDGKEVLAAVGSGGLIAAPLQRPDRDGNPKPKLVVADAFPSARFSPDGRWVLYGTRGGSYVQPYPGPGLRTQIARVDGFPVWRKDGKEILIADRWNMEVWSVQVAASGGRLSFGHPELLLSGLRWPNGLNGGSLPIAVSRDGSRIYYAQAVEQPADSNVIHILTGWAGR